MMEIFRLTFPVAGVVFRTAVRSRAYVLFSLLSLAASAAGTLPLSPGLAAGPRHYLSAGVSTLLLGGVLLSLVALPGVHPAGRGRMKEEALLALPVPSEAFVLGTFFGFAGALVLYFAAGGGLFAAAATATSNFGAARFDIPLALAAAALLGLTAAALVTLLKSLLSPAPALIAALLVLLLGQVSTFLPRLPAVLLPPFDVLDPSRVFRNGEGVGPADFLRGAACLALYLFLAAAIQAWKGTNPPGPGMAPGSGGSGDRWGSR